MKLTATLNASTAKTKISRKTKTAPEAETRVSRTLKPDDMELEEWQTRLRRQFAEGQPFQLKNVGEHPIFSEFTLTNPATDRTYRIPEPAVMQSLFSGLEKLFAAFGGK